jgi:hypothetical protein
LEEDEEGRRKREGGGISFWRKRGRGIARREVQKKYVEPKSRQNSRNKKKQGSTKNLPEKKKFLKME